MKRLLVMLLAALLLLLSAAAFAESRPGWIEIQEGLPEGYLSPAQQQGRVEEFTYSAADGEKTALVYLPYGYDGNDSSYNVLYFMHGGGGSPYLYFTPGGQSALSNLLDHMIQDGLTEPLIVVAPTFYPPDDNDASVSNAGILTARFPEELTSALMPAVESTYRTYAEDTTPEGFRASREHRAFGGFSMGGVTTWYVFLNNLDAFSCFIPLSGDCWVMGQMGGRSAGEATATALAEAVTSQGYTSDDFMIYALTGTSDIAYDTLTSQMEAMTGEDIFRFGENTLYCLMPGGTHNHLEMRQYLYEALQVIWPKE